jgi:hypothetical protein
MKYVVLTFYQVWQWRSTNSPFRSCHPSFLFPNSLPGCPSPYCLLSLPCLTNVEIKWWLRKPEIQIKSKSLICPTSKHVTTSTRCFASYSRQESAILKYEQDRSRWLAPTVSVQLAYAALVAQALDESTNAEEDEAINCWSGKRNESECWNKNTQLSKHWFIVWLLQIKDILCTG